MRIRVLSIWSARRSGPLAAVALLAALGAMLTAGPAFARGRTSFCSRTAWLQLAACQAEGTDDLLTGKAICLNVSDNEERVGCYADVGGERGEQRELCGDQFDARLDVCEQLGEDRYDPDFDPDAFSPDPKNPVQANDYFPLAVDDEWDYEGGGEETHVQVQDATKLIEDVRCIVVTDTVTEDGDVTEDTNDWFGLASSGDVWYCGEQTATFETFPGDDPATPEQVDIEGAWKAGRDGAKPGIQFLADPQVGDIYRQEWSPGDAEDIAVVVSTDYDWSTGGELNDNVPQALAEALCDHDCIVTREFTPIDPDPDAVELKYSAKGVGVFLEVTPATGDTVQLKSCSLSNAIGMGKCALLP